MEVENIVDMDKLKSFKVLLVENVTQITLGNNNKFRYSCNFIEYKN